MHPLMTQLQADFPPSTVVALVTAIERAVTLSHRRHPLRGGMTEAETKERIAWCCATAVSLRREQRWSTERICDSLPTALDVRLRDGSWTPPAGRTWFGG